MNELTNWLMVFLRVSAMLAVFPVFSARNFPVQLRLALGALLAGMVSRHHAGRRRASRPIFGDWSGRWRWRSGSGLLIGFASRMIFFALEIAGSIISTEIGLSMPPGLNPLSESANDRAGSMLYYLAAMLWLTLDMHHWMLVAFQENLHLSADRRGAPFPGAC